MELLTKTPNECTNQELSEFKELVLDGGGVMAEGLLDRIKSAENLIFVRDGKCIGVGAIKRPYGHYKKSVFKKTGVSNISNDYLFELGWVYASPSSREKGVGRRIMEAIIKSIGNAGCFATTREDNNAMHYLLEQYGFLKVGKKYKSNSGNYSLVLYVYQP